MSKREKRREICHIRGVAQSDVGNWEYEPIWKPDPEAPSVSEVVEALEACVDTLYDHNIGRQQIHRAQAIIARLEGA